MFRGVNKENYQIHITKLGQKLKQDIIIIDAFCNALVHIYWTIPTTNTHNNYIDPMRSQNKHNIYIERFSNISYYTIHYNTQYKTIQRKTKMLIIEFGMILFWVGNIDQTRPRCLMIPTQNFPPYLTNSTII